METLGQVLPIVLYFLGGVLLVVLIAIALRLYETLGKVNLILDNVKSKAESLDNAFDMVDKITDGMNHVSNVVVDGLVSFASNVFGKKKKKKNKKVLEEDDEDE